MAKANGKNNDKGGASTGTGVAVGAAAAAAAAAAVAAAGAYWFYGAKDAAKHRKTAKSWMLKARAETMEAVENAVEKLGEIDKETYLKIVDGIVKRYSGVAGVTSSELAQMTKDLKAAWAHMHAARRIATKPAVKRVVKKAAKAAKKKR
jgi:hypothetical protein